MSSLEPREYSKRLGVLTPAQLQAALDRFDLGALISAEPAPGGLFGQNVMIVSSTGRWVLRGAPHHDQQFPRECYFSRIIHERTQIAAPWPFRIDDGAGIFDWPFAVMPWLDGVALTDDDRSLRSAEGDIAIARAMGEGLALLQEATWPEHAWFDADAGELRSLGKSYADWYIEWAEHWLTECRKASLATTDDDVAWVESVIDDARESLAVPFQAAFVHTDYAEGNVVVQAREPNAWRVSGVFDLADAYMGDGEADLARSYLAFQRKDPLASEAFFAAYANLRPVRPGFAARWRLYVLRDRMVFWEYGHRNNLWFRPGMSLRQWVERYVELPPPV